MAVSSLIWFYVSLKSIILGVLAYYIALVTSNAPKSVKLFHDNTTYNSIKFYYARIPSAINLAP